MEFGHAFSRGVSCAHDHRGWFRDSSLPASHAETVERLPKRKSRHFRQALLTDGAAYEGRLSLSSRMPLQVATHPAQM